MTTDQQGAGRPSDDLWPVLTDEGEWECMGDGRRWSTRERALQCPCGAGLRAMQGAAAATLATVQGVVDRAVAVLGAVIDHASPGAGTPMTLAQLADAVTQQTAATDALRAAVDQLVMGQLPPLPTDLPTAPELDELPGLPTVPPWLLADPEGASL